MPCVRHIIVCEGESEWGYLQTLQGFLDQQPLLDGTFESPLRLITPRNAIAKSGRFADLKRCHVETRRQNKNTSIQIWTDFDLYHRNLNGCATSYLGKARGLPDFLFSFHNFEDFLALHWEGDRFESWLRFGRSGHFETPLHAVGYLPEFQRIFPNYSKAELPLGFIGWPSLRNLKCNLARQPSSNPHNLPNLQSFAGFLVGEIERAYPGRLG
jgi:hypothetical protein